MREISEQNQLAKQIQNDQFENTIEELRKLHQQELKEKIEEIDALNALISINSHRSMTDRNNETQSIETMKL